MATGFGFCFGAGIGFELGGGEEFAFDIAIATPFFRASIGRIWSSWSSVSFAGARPCAAARLT